jgi:hypothetical protein
MEECNGRAQGGSCGSGHTACADLKELSAADVHCIPPCRMLIHVSRRKFFKICAGGMAGTTAAALGFAPKMALAQARNYKFLRLTSIAFLHAGC